jgi:hypothetical protein
MHFRKDILKVRRMPTRVSAISRPLVGTKRDIECPQPSARDGQQATGTLPRIGIGMRMQGHHHANRTPAGPTNIYQARGPDFGRSMATVRLLEQFAVHPLTPDERVTTQSMLQEPSSRILVMPTHHINEMGDMMGFRSV